MRPFLPPLSTFGPLRITAEPSTDHPAYAALLTDAPRTGWCPVLVTGAQHLTPPDDPAAAVRRIARTDPAELLGRAWPGTCRPGCGCRDPFGDRFPGLVAARPRRSDPVAVAAGYARRPGRTRLALVPATRPADVPAAAGWGGTRGADDAELGAVLRSWEDRFGARLVVMQPTTLWLSVAAPPRTEQECLGVAAEHVALCPGADGEDPRPLRMYAGALRGRPWWRFSWG